MKGLLTTLNRSALLSKGFKNVSSPTSFSRVSSSSLILNKPFINHHQFSTSLVTNNNESTTTSKPLTQLEQSMLQGINAVIQHNHQAFSSGDFLTVQKNYEQIYNQLTKSNDLIKNDLIKSEILKLNKTSLEQLSKIKKEELVLPIYKLEWKIASALQNIGEYEQAIIKITNALNSVPKESEEIVQMKILKASILNSMGLFDQGFELHNKALMEIGPKVTWKNGYEASISFYELGEYFLNKGENGKAITNFEKSLSISEGFYGWMSPQTTKSALILSRLYLETNKIDFSVILGEKSLVGIEIFLDLFDANQITISGSYLARSYERKGFYPFQQSTISRVYNLLRRKKNDTDTQTYMECIFKLENMMGSCRFFQGHLKLADQTFTKLDQLAESVMPEWIKKDSEEAQFELAYMKYFKGVCKIGLKENQIGIKELEQAKSMFLALQRNDWAAHCDQYIHSN